MNERKWIFIFVNCRRVIELEKSSEWISPLQKTVACRFPVCTLMIKFCLLALFSWISLISFFNFGTKYPWGFWLEEKKFNFLLKNLKLLKLVTGKRQVRKCNSIVWSRISRTSNILLRAHLSNHIGLLSLHGGFNLHQSAHKRQVYFIISNNKRKKKVENLLVKKDLGEPGVYHWRGSLYEALVQILYDSLHDRIDLRCKRKKLKYHNCSSQIQTEIRLCKIYLILRWAQSPWSSKIQPVLQKITVWNELKGNRNFLAMWVSSSVWNLWDTSSWSSTYL